MGSGKTTAANILVTGHDFTRVSFAGPLKKLVMKITPDRRIDKVRDRALLQFLGTEYFRTIDPDYWVKQWERAVAERVELTRGDCRIVVDDCRFANEAEAVRRLGGHSFFLESDPAERDERITLRDGGDSRGTAGHESEAVGFGEGEVTIPNDKGLDYLRADIHRIMKELLNGSVT
jgi:hypothetical protein